MKLRNLLAIVIVTILSQAATAFAADWYAVSLRGTCKYVDGSDRIVRRNFNNTTLIKDYLATLEEPPLAKHLKVGYDPEGDRISIVNTNGESVRDVYSFASGTVVTNSTDTLRERQMFVYPGSSVDAIGSALISERIARTEEGVITRLTSRGTLQFSHPAEGDLPAEVCNATFTAARKIKFPAVPAEPATE